ncbi:MAG: hypothetical protein Q4D22_00065 [Candidatus Saccharibacteria bacterium]|nr:hypothetical protein [Candidatus Saccharibacteria bacterium]
MLVIGSKMIGCPVMSLHIGGQVAYVVDAVIDPEDLRVIAYILDGPAIQNDPDVGFILVADDIRELNADSIIIDSTDILVNPEDVIRVSKILELNFSLIGLKVVTPKSKKKIGKVVDYTLDSQSMMIYQLIVQRPVGIMAINDPQLTINRSQIVEIDDYTVTIKHDKEQIKVPEKKEKVKIEELEEQKREFVNPFRKPSYAPEENSESASSISE